MAVPTRLRRAWDAIRFRPFLHSWQGLLYAMVAGSLITMGMGLAFHTDEKGRLRADPEWGLGVMLIVDGLALSSVSWMVHAFDEAADKAEARSRAERVHLLREHPTRAPLALLLYGALAVLVVAAVLIARAVSAP